MSAGEPSRARVAGVVLAAGASSRMGRPKASLAIDGQPMLVRVLRALRTGGAEPLLVVAGAPDDATTSALARSEGARVALNPDPSRGMLSSLRAGLAALADEPDVAGVAVALVDQPHLAASSVAAVLARLREGGAGVVRPWIETPTGPRHGHPYVLARSAWRYVEQAADDGDGMRGVLRALADCTKRVEVEDRAILEDLDTPADLGS